MALNNATALLLLSSLTHDSLAEDTNVPYPQPVNSTFVLELVRSIDDLYQFKNFIFYITERLNLESDTAVHFFQDFWSTFPTAPNIIIRSDKYSYPMDGFVSTPALVLILTTEEKDPIMNLAAQSLRGVRILKTIFILFPIMTTDKYFENANQLEIFWEAIRTTYEWAWRQQFVNSILITLGNNLFLLDPYPTFKIVNKTGQWQATDFFEDWSTDLKGFKVDTLIRYDLPRVFHKVYVKNGQKVVTELSGISGNLFTSFIESINATLNDTTNASTHLQPVDMNEIISLLRDKSIEISVHSYTDIPGFNAGSSYPIGINDWCVMVPYRNRSPEHLYLQHTFQNSTWLLIGFAFVYISLSIWLCSAERPRDYSAAFLQTLCSLLAIVPTSALCAPTARMRFFFCILFVLGFVLSNMFVSKLYSYLTSSPQQQQINSVPDIIADNLKIMIIDIEFKVLNSLPNLFTPRFLKQLQIVSKPVMDLHRDRLNTSYGYSVQSDRWRFLNMQQQFLQKPLFRLTDICSGPYYHVFPMRRDSHLHKRFKYFTMYVSQSGFLEYWQKASFADALRLRYVSMITVQEETMPLSLRFFRPVWVVWWFGLVVSGVAFIIEMKWSQRIRLKQLYANIRRSLRNW